MLPIPLLCTVGMTKAQMGELTPKVCALLTGMARIAQTIQCQAEHTGLS